MRKQNENKTVWVIASVSLLVIFVLRCFDTGIVAEPDATFLYNRCYQMWDCIKNGFVPFIYYNDVGGIGYASPIFYGQLTLVPFIPFLGSISTFMKVYTLVCLLLNFFGFRFFCKRFSSHATLASCFYVLGVPFIMLIGSGMYANQLANGFIWLFLGYCIDYFRDREHFPFVILTYFLIWQSNLNAVVFAFVGCCGLFIVWFDVKRWKDYLRLFVCTLMTMSYNIVNILVHRDAIRLADYDTLFPGGMSLLSVVMSNAPFGGFLYRSICYSLGYCDLACGFMSFAMLVTFSWYIRRGFDKESNGFKVVAISVGVACVIGYVLGMASIWGTVFKATGAFFQFPIRYYVLLWGLAVAVLSRVIQWNKGVCLVLVLSVLDIFIANPLTSGSLVGGVDDLLLTIGHGEYAGSNFVQDIGVWETYRTGVVSASGIEYSWENEYNGGTVDCSPNRGDDVLALPKLYYVGYQATGSNGETFEVTSGYSNYCQVVIGDYQGQFTLRYRVPTIVKAFLCFQFACLMALGYCVLDNDSKWRRLRV